MQTEQFPSMTVKAYDPPPGVSFKELGTGQKCQLRPNFDHLEEIFVIKTFGSKMFCPPVKTTQERELAYESPVGMLIVSFRGVNF